MKEIQPNYYSVITANVRYDKQLKANEKLLFSEITALATSGGYCHAKNAYFAKLYDVSKITISRWINHLSERGYLNIKTVYKGKQIVERKLYPIDTPINKKINTPINKKVNTYIQKDQGVLTKMLRMNTTSLNTTSLNSSSSTPTTKNGCEEKTQNQKSVSDNKQDSDSLKDPQHVSEVYNRWNDTWGKPSEAVEEAITKWVNEFGYEVVIHAINYADPRLKDISRAYGYLRSMMSNYHDHEVKTVADAEKADREYQTGSNKGQQSPQQQLPASNDQQARDIQKYSRHLLKKRRSKHQRVKEPMPAWSKKSQAELNKQASDADVAKLKERLANRKKAQEG